MSDPLDADGIAEQIAAHLESLRRAGIDRLPVSSKTAVGRVAEPAPAIAEARRKPPQETGEPAPLSIARRPRGEVASALARLDEEVRNCTRCEICKTRTRTVFGEGNPEARLLFVGEAPGADEDRTGRPFVGKAGQLLDRMIEAIRLRREDVFIANVLKCRPPGNRTPRPDEAEYCFPYLHAQIELLRPSVICTLGAPAARAILGTERSIGSIRGRVFHYRETPVVPTYHPAYLLRNPADKILVWKDLQVVAGLLGIELGSER